MRQIKFRVWDRQNKSIFYPHEIYFSENLKQIKAIDCMDNYIENGIPRFIVMEYIGLKDKNGKEIYVGDIVYSPDGAFVPDYHSYCAKYIGWFYYEEDESIDWESFEELYASGDDVEVIGNIYQNSNLLPRKVINAIKRKIEGCQDEIYSQKKQ